jgi:Ca-activated chloride channel family protein
MFDFANPYLLSLLAAVPVVWGLYELAQLSRRRKLKKFGNPEVFAHLMPDASKYKPAIKITLQLLALIAIIFILVRPRFGEKDESKTVEGIEVMVTFDVSNSMLAASTDDPKSISRLRRAKLLLEKLVDRLDNDKVGLVVFAGEAKTKMPMTTDFYTAKMFINDLEPSIIQAQGTCISDALQMSMNAFSKKQDVHKAIILITDAEEHEGQAVDVAKEAAKQGIQVDVVGVGTSKGARIPLGKGSKSFMTDYEGNEVITAVDEKAAAEIAAAGKGIYVNGANPAALDKLSDELSKLGKTELKSVKYKTSAEQFPVFAWLALILLVADLLVIERKISWLKNVNFFSKTPKKPTEK